MNQPLTTEQQRIPAEFQDVFDEQQAYYRAHRNPGYQERVADLKALHRMLVENREALIEAVNSDYGCRSRFETIFSELLINQDGILDAIKQLKKWMKPQKRHLDATQYPLAKARVIAQPLGVVGIVVPWNFPISMAFSPLTGIFAAGNTAMIKMSENSNALAKLFRELAPKYFPRGKLAFFEDGNGRGPAFTSLPFDHLFFTGSPATGRSVMANCARHLTPVTLELGGKSPTVIAPDFNFTKAVERIMWVKMFNAGQICTNVDYLFLPEGREQAFVDEARRICNARYPDINNGDYTAVIDQRSYDRLQATLEDARAKGARIINLFEEQQPDAERRIFPPHIVLDVNDDMEIMQREVFGPLLPVMTYRDREAVVDYIDSHPHPLAFYVYSNDKSLVNWYIDNTMSGGVTVNDGLLHAAQHDLPFGGVGNSGMGHYHGYEGFSAFSKLRPVFQQGPLRSVDMLMPPYAGKANWILNFMLKMKS
ncbi:coniferyl aldehyde dehydrogenase [Seongchinamella unica]|uniref:Aldehyde dehydrogenase n=1 Tax=Seongchinamella unica TaxID=2547392 RepID=A0A4R5LQJ1_9GAMM|nr:coniferyl aldehyde dehydrogenase [Seongchinamella unica]TDG12832.1 coniferyl aldehyde dehydrogenase [Seongchinamella unica]